MIQGNIVQQLEEIAKPQKICLAKNCKKEVAAVQKLAKEFKKNTDAMSKKIDKYGIDFKNGKINRDQYIDKIQKEVKYGFSLIDKLIHSKDVKNHTECSLKYCLTEFKISLKFLIQMLDNVCKQMHVKVVCDAKKGFEKMVDKEKINANEYLALVTHLFKEAEKMMLS